MLKYKSTIDCVNDLKNTDQLVEIKNCVDPYLDIAQLTRMVFKVGGPCLLFTNVKASKFPVCSNLFGTIDRSNYIFRDSLTSVKSAIELKANPVAFLKYRENYGKFFALSKCAINSFPKKISPKKAPVLANSISINQIPQIVSWPEDGGAFITLPQVLSFPEDQCSIVKANLGMYRIQLSGNNYKTNQEIGLHYQIRRTIGLHHRKAIENNRQFKIAIHIGGPPSHTISAVMPMPDNLSELVFAGMLGNQRVRWCEYQGYRVLADADFCILGYVGKDLKDEGPFGDHLGYYSLKHLFPYVKVQHVFARDKAVLNITVVGRPPQEDSIFGALIHKLTAAMVPVSLPGIKEINAVDQAGVHPLLLAIGSENYTPYVQAQKPMEIITQAFAILGFNQCSLAKYLIIASGNNYPRLSTKDLKGFFIHVLERISFSRDLLILSRTTIDTLDYSSKEFNFGSKAILVCGDKKLRELSSSLEGIKTLRHIDQCAEVMCGIVAISLVKINSKDSKNEEKDLSYHNDQDQLLQSIQSLDLKSVTGIMLVVVCDDPINLGKNFANFLWTTFTLSNPGDNLFGKNQRWERKHFSFDGPLFIDARSQKHHSNILVEDSASKERMEKLIDSHTLLKKWF